MAWARDNAELSGLKDKPVRWIVEDARVFALREIRRGRAYDGIIMDPPAFGHGPGNELWKIEEHFLPLVENCKKLLKPKPLFFLINGYSAGYSAIAYKNNLLPLKERFGGEIELGELAIEESKSQRLLPCGIFARWSARQN
jgi:23S rRNA (cytosine1962-C5)-methyltransferase